MNEMNWLEAHLHSWRPRRPSAGLRRRLGRAPRRPRHRVAWLLGTLAPATACALLTLALSGSENGMAVRAGGQPAAGTWGWSGGGQLALADLPQGQNQVPNCSFNWTNRSGTTSGVVTFSQGRLN